MHPDKLRATLAELEQELQALPSVDDETRIALQDTVETIRARLNESNRPQTQPSSLTERLSDAVVQFEGEHPNLTAILGRLIDGLAQMGI